MTGWSADMMLVPRVATKQN